MVRLRDLAMNAGHVAQQNEWPLSAIFEKIINDLSGRPGHIVNPPVPRGSPAVDCRAGFAVSQ